MPDRSLPDVSRSAVLRWPPRVTAAFLRFPGRYLDPDAAGGIDVVRWSEEFEWEQDAWSGYRDTVDPVEEVIETARGDCDDYAVVVASWAVARGRDPSLVLCKEDGQRFTAHVAVWDGERVYSSGDVHDDTDPDEYVEGSQYDTYHLRDVD